MSELFLVRHGQASFHSDNYDQLSPLGHQQAQWLGQYFKQRNLEFDTILMGDMVRHRETKEGICLGMGAPELDAEVYPELNEFDFKRLTEAYLSTRPDERPAKDAAVPEFYRVLRKALHAWAADGHIEGAPETWSNFEDRIDQMLTMIQDRPSKQKVLVVSSGGAISMALRQILQSPPQTMINLNLQTRNTGVSQCFFNSKGFNLNSFNHVPHLDHPERMDSITYS